MDLFPSLGEPGILDDLFWFGPLAIQIVFAVFFFWLTAKWMKGQSNWSRLGMTFWMVLVADFCLFVAAGLVFKMSTGL